MPSSPPRARRTWFRLRTTDPSRRAGRPSPRRRSARRSRTAPSVARSTPRSRCASAPRAPSPRGRLARGTGAARAGPAAGCRVVGSGARGASPTRRPASRHPARGTAACHRWRRSQSRADRRAGSAANRPRPRPPDGPAETRPLRSSRTPPTTGRCRPPRVRRRRTRRTVRAARGAPGRPVATTARGRRSLGGPARGFGEPRRGRFAATTPPAGFPRGGAPASCRGWRPRNP